MSAITAAASGVWTYIKDEFLWGSLVDEYGDHRGTGLCLKDTPPLERVKKACGGLICGVPWALAGFGHYLFAQRGTKVFGATATDDDVKAFCSSSAALAVYSIEIHGSGLVTKRALDAIGQCFWLTKIEIRGCKNLDGACMA